MSETNFYKKEDLDKLLHEYAVYVLKMGQIPSKDHSEYFLKDVRERTHKILLKKKELASNITRLFDK